MRMGVTNEHATMYTTVGVHSGVKITLVVASDGGIGAEIHFGHDGPDLVMDFADVNSLERLSAVAADGARRLRASANGLDLVSEGR